MKSYKYLTMACLLPILWSGSADLYAKDKELLSPKVSPQLIEPCLEPAKVQSPSVNRIEPIDDCDGGGGGSTGPYYPPGTPGSIKTPTYTNDSNYRVTWSSGNGYGYSVRNELYQQTNNGSWSKVYDGYGTSKYFTASSGKALKRYRVRSCNSKGCSGYRYSDKMMVNYQPRPNLYAEYSFLSNIDQKATAYKSSADSYKSALIRDDASSGTTFSTTSSGERFYLGDGYDLIRGSLKQTCLDVDQANFQITQNTPYEPVTFNVDYVENNDHLAELLDVSASAKVGFTGDDLSLGVSGEKSRFVESISDHDTIRFVVKIVNREENWRLATSADPIDPDFTNNMLSPNDADAKADFREFCGDAFIDGANVGSALYLVFSFDSKKYSYTEREQKKGQLGLKLGDVFNANGAASSNSELEILLENLQVSISASQVGGPEGLSASVTPANVVDKYNQFLQGTNSSNWAAVEFSTRQYVRPSAYSNYPHSAIFADFTGNQGPLAQMRRWANISVQHTERCSPWSDYNRSTPSQCGSSQIEISTAMDACRNTRQWTDCEHPLAYTTGAISAAYPGVNLYNWLNSNVKKLEKTSVSDTYDHHVYKGSIAVDDYTCLAATSCFANPYRGTGPGIGKGFEVITYEYDNPKGTGRSYRISPQHCVNSTAYLDTRNWFMGDTTADWHYKVKLEGLCPELEDFVIVQ
ncbi:MAG: hypothetical protein OQJ80_03520 [Kangiella sp.]|nr:hypothetical protein [Kangiella sp.]